MFHVWISPWDVTERSARGEVRVASRGQEILSFASQGVCFTCINGVLSCQPQLWRVASCGWYGIVVVATKDMDIQKSNNWKALTHFYCTSYTIICSHTELLNDIDNTVVISCYCIMFKPYLKKNIFGEEDRHSMFLISPISSYCYDLMKTRSTERVLMQ